MKQRKWIIGVGGGLLCATSLVFGSKIVDSDPEERLGKEEGLTLSVGLKPRRGFEPEELEDVEEEELEDSIARLIQATEDYSDLDNQSTVFDILLLHLYEDDLDLILQIINENLNTEDQESLIEDVKRFMDSRGQIRGLQILEEHLERNDLPLSALSEEDREFVKECNPEGRESEAYGRLLGELSEYLQGQQSESGATPEEDPEWEKRFKHSVARQFKLIRKPVELDEKNTDHEKLIKIELTIALREREFTAKEKMQLDKAIRNLNRSPKQRLLDAIFSASYVPRTAFQRAKSIIEEGDMDVNSKHKKLSFLVVAAGICQDGGLEIVRLLLDYGADVDMVDDDRRNTALHGAACCGNIEVVKLLLDRGANVNIKNRDNMTPLVLAWASDHSEITELLIESGAEVDTQLNPDTDRPLFVMAIQRRKEKYDETERRRIRNYIDELHLQTT
jgi:hypothetical protein